MTAVPTTFDVAMVEFATTDTPMKVFNLEPQILVSVGPVWDELAAWRVSAAASFWGFEDSLPESE